MNFKNLSGGTEDSEAEGDDSRMKSFSSAFGDYGNALGGRPQEKHEEPNAELKRLRSENDALSKALGTPQMSPTLTNWASRPGFGAPANSAAANVNTAPSTPGPTQPNNGYGHVQQPSVTSPQVTSPSVTTPAPQQTNPFVFSRSAPDLSALDEAYRRMGRVE